MKIFYAANIDHTNTGSYAHDEDETHLDPRVVGTILTFIHYGWKEGTVTEKGRNERYSYYEIEVDNLELL
jgi:hypothetical protein